MKLLIGTIAAALLSLCAFAQDAPPAPDVNKVIEDLATVGPEALLSRVKELKTAEQALKDEAAALRAQADQKDAEAAAARARVEAVERFTNDLATAMAPTPAPEVATPEVPVVPAPETVAVAEPVAPEAPVMPAEPVVAPPAEAPVEAVVAQPAPEPAPETMGMVAPENTM